MHLEMPTKDASDNTLVAVYGSLRVGQGNHRIIAEYEPLSREWSVPEFTMHNLGGFPALVAGKNTVLLELYKVDDDTFAQLDILEGYPHFYNRRQVRTSLGDAWVYFIEDLDHSHGVVDSGDWSEFLIQRYA